MKITTVIIYTNGLDSFRKAIVSLFTDVTTDLIVIDNSISKSLKVLFPHLNIYETDVQITCSQAFNLAQEFARKNNSDVLVTAHSDIIVNDYNRLLAFYRYLEELIKDKTLEWGVIFTMYDSIAAFNMDYMDLIGEWDQVISQYPVDVDYYKRMNIAGLEKIDFGGEGFTHEGSVTINSNSFYKFATHKFVAFKDRQYTSLKWGNVDGEPSYYFPFNGQMYDWMYNDLINSELYKLSNNFINCVEGNLLQDQTEDGRRAQFALLLNIIKTVKPKLIIETGTNKAFFIQFLAQFLDYFTIYTFDNNRDCQIVCNAINKFYPSLEINFICGDTNNTVKQLQLKESVDLAWIDGAHTLEGCLSDLTNCNRLKTKLILIDDSKNIKEVQNAIELFLTAHEKKYYKLKNPYWEKDDRGITILKRYRDDN
jgi:hypothetical protein